MRKIFKKTFSCFFVFFVFFQAVFATEADLPSDISGNAASTVPVSNDGTDLLSYDEYLAGHENVKAVSDSITIPGSEIKPDVETGATLGNYQGESNVLLWNSQKGKIDIPVTISESGLYQITLTYCAMEGKERELEYKLAIDGAVPFRGADALSFTRCFVNEGEKDSFDQDNQGNDIRPVSQEVFIWQEAPLRDKDGLHTAPYQFYLEKGAHELTLECVREPIAIKSVTLSGMKESPSYQAMPTAVTGVLDKYQAELGTRRSHPSLTPANDRTNPANEPSDPVKIRLNSISSSAFKYSGQWVEWTVNVQEEGYYKLGVRYKQGDLRGLFVSRRILVNGELPFKEAENLHFGYDGDWQFCYFGGQEGEYLFHLNQGTNRIRMEVTLGEFAPIVSNIQDQVFELNDMYRRIVMITGAYPDIYRDYKLQSTVPGMIDCFTNVSKELRGQLAIIESTIGKKGSEAVIIEELCEMLDSFVKRPNTIPERLTKFKDNISSLASWMLTIKEQPMSLDYLVVASPEQKAPEYKANFFQKATYEVAAFLGSFFTDYTNIGDISNDENRITVWVGAGRDQASVLKQLIRNDFEKKNDVKVNLSVVQGALLQATMAGKGPDVALMVGRGDPVNLGMRGALEPLENYPGFDQAASRFMNNALEPYQHKGHTYALPETQVFHMMFYRTDIFKELGIEPPETWDDLYLIAPIIQSNNMDIGLPYASMDAYTVVSAGMGSQTLYPALMLQSGGCFYTDDLQQTDLESPEAFAAFKMWTDFYNQYSFTLYKDDYSRFRTGEIPLTIANYTFYNQLSVAAPEIHNLWEMVPIPGTKKADGTIDRSESASGTACIMLKDTQNKDAAWEFMNWWTSDAVQSEYGQELENLLGTAGRYNPASVEAFREIGWTAQELDVLETQWKSVIEIPEVPGGYYTSRNVDNAFRAVVISGENARESLYYWNKETNKEIARKWKEFSGNQ